MERASGSRASADPEGGARDSTDSEKPAVRTISNVAARRRAADATPARRAGSAQNAHDSSEREKTTQCHHLEHRTNAWNRALFPAREARRSQRCENERAPLGAFSILGRPRILPLSRFNEAREIER